MVVETESHRQRPAAIDGVSIGTLLAALLFVLPSRLGVPGLGAAGSPALVLALGSLLWWMAYRVLGRSDVPRRRAVNVAVWIWVWAVVVSSLVAATRPIAYDEARSNQLGLLAVAGWLGIYLLISDGVPNLQRLGVFVGRVAGLAGVVAAVGIVQFLTRETWVDRLSIPGLVPTNGAYGAVFSRGGLLRPTGTAVHPIEFGLVVTTFLPYALHHAAYGASRRWTRFVPLFLLCAAVPISISRSAAICGAAALLILLPTWPRAWRRVMYTFAAVGTGVAASFSPGLLSTFVSLFSSVSDSSTLSRTQSYDLAGLIVGQWPVFGRGFVTFLPKYRILDNQYLGLLIDTGFVGLLAFLGVVVTAVVGGVRARALLTDPAERHLVLACVAAVAVNALGFAFFDALSFPMAGAAFFLVVGSASSARRCTLEKDRQSHRGRRGRRGRVEISAG